MAKAAPVEPTSDPRPVNMQKTSKSELEEFTLQLQSLQSPCGFLHLLLRI